MPRFFFNVCNGHGDTIDEEGLELENQSAARRIAIDSIRSMVAEDARQGLIDLNARIEVKDDGDNALLIIAYREAFELRLADAKASP